MTVRVGLDIGGTKTAAMVADAAGRCLGLESRPTDAADATRLVAGIVAAVDAALAQAGAARRDVATVGVGVPGQIDPARGTVSLAVNLNLHEPFPLRQALQDALGAPVTLENDVRAAAWGAFHWANERRPVRSLAYLSIGTGIAAGLVLDGRLYRGAHGMAGEIGHVPLDATGPRCRCGAYGCLEVYAAGPAIAAQAAAALPAGAAPDTSEVYALAAQGQPVATEIVDRAAGYLARAVYLLAMTYDVEQIALGGGVTRAGNDFERPLRHALAALRADSPLAATMLPDEAIVVLPAELNAGLIGAVYLADLADATSRR
jgi:glucokinase